MLLSFARSCSLTDDCKLGNHVECDAVKQALHVGRNSGKSLYVKDLNKESRDKRIDKGGVLRPAGQGGYRRRRP